MDSDDSRSLLKGILRFFARKPLAKSSLGAQALNTWVRTDSYQQHEANDLNEIDSKQVARTLRTFENLVQYESNRDLDSVSNAISWIKVRSGTISGIVMHFSRRSMHCDACLLKGGNSLWIDYEREVLFKL